MELEECPSSANRWRHKSFLNPTDSKWPNDYQFDELQLAMEILDMELRADQLKWQQDSEVRGEGREGLGWDLRVVWKSTNNEGEQKLVGNL